MAWRLTKDILDTFDKCLKDLPARPWRVSLSEVIAIETEDGVDLCDQFGLEENDDDGWITERADALVFILNHVDLLLKAAKKAKVRR